MKVILLKRILFKSLTTNNINKQKLEEKFASRLTEAYPRTQRRMSKKHLMNTMMNLNKNPRNKRTRTRRTLTNSKFSIAWLSCDFMIIYITWRE